MVYAVVVAVVVLATFHVVVGLASICVGVASSIQAEVWLAHTVSPIWSGGFFVITGILGFACAKRKTAYMIMCFTAFSIVSLMTAIVSIQLLRLGLVNHTTDGNTYQKEEKDILILVALGDAGFEILICLISSIVSCRMAKAAKNELFQKRAGCFHVQTAFRLCKGYFEFRWNKSDITSKVCRRPSYCMAADSGPGDTEADDDPPIWGANQHGEVCIPTDGRHAYSGQGHANPAVTSDQGTDWLDLSYNQPDCPGPSNKEKVQIHRPYVMEEDVSPRSDPGVTLVVSKGQNAAKYVDSGTL